VELVHKSWTTETSVYGGPASIAGWWSSPEPGLRPFRGSRLTAKGGGGGVEHGNLSRASPEGERQ
jgi:hypothetical protein